MASRKLKKVVLSCVITGLLSYSLPSYADDSEVYFSSLVADIKANVLFIIDVSGSMNYELGSDNVADDRTKGRMAVLKDSLMKILADPNTNKLRMGLMSFSTVDYPFIRQPVVDIDEIDKDKDIKKTVSGNETTLEQTILTDGDDGFEQTITQGKVGYGPAKPTWVINRDMKDTDEWSTKGQDGQIKLNRVVLANANFNPRYAAFRFNNILLKNPSSVSLNASSIKKATLKFYGGTGPVGAGHGVIRIPVSIDEAVNSPYLRPELNNNIASRKMKSLPNPCILKDPGPGGIEDIVWQECDVTELIQYQVAKADWQDGNAITIIIQPPTKKTTFVAAHFREASVDVAAKLEITVDNPLLIAKNKKLNKEKILDAAMALYPYGATAIVSSLYKASGYISNIPKGASAAGPYHFPEYANEPSPLIDKCQLTHIALMTDGVPEFDESKSTVEKYISEPGCSALGKDKGGSYACGKSLVNWMAKTSQSNYKEGEGNYVRTHTISFALRAGAGIAFLKELAEYGQGKYYNAKDADSLVEAFQNIIESALGAARPSANGSVAMGAQSNYDQRAEVFYGLYNSSSYDYWAGNVKGFRIAFDDYTLSDGSKIQRAVLKDWSGQHYVMASDGSFIGDLSSAWSTGDSGIITRGGVVSKLAAPDVRKIYTLKANAGSINGGEAIALDSSATVSSTDLGLTNGDNTEAHRKGLLDFIHGYNYIDNGIGSGKASVATPKIGESTNNGVSLLSYGNCGGKDVLTCDYNTLQMVGLYATNDGVFRGYDLTNGKALFEFMPQQMLPLINNLEKRKVLNRDIIKTYGLSTRVAISHDDKNKNGIVDGDEKAYAIVSAGKGGPYIYGIDITNKTAPRLAWTIENTGPFSKLGNTWSVPVAGTIKVGNTMTPVIVFGGGYDTRQDGDKNYDGQANLPQTTDNVGNALYVVDVQTGQLLWSTSIGMQYSIPGQVATVTDSQGLITDLFFGDMGGQLWRFVVHNGKTGNDLLSPGSAADGIVANIAGNDADNSRRFYQTPMIYKLPGGKQLSVNIGTGYKAHPLVKNNEDRFYSFRFPLEANPQSNKIITEDDLGLLDPMDTTKGPTKKEYGFMLKLEASKGEKVISNAFADFDTLVFNTYIPDTGEIGNNSCVVNKVGTQRTYYFSLSTGKSFLETGYTEISPATLPLDSVAYCNKNACTVISSMGMLAKKPTNVPDAAIIQRDKEQAIKKTTWSDLFNPDVD